MDSILNGVSVTCHRLGIKGLRGKKGIYCEYVNVNVCVYLTTYIVGMYSLYVWENQCAMCIFEFRRCRVPTRHDRIHTHTSALSSLRMGGSGCGGWG